MDNNSQNKKKPRSGSAQFWVVTNERDSCDKIQECFLLLSLRSLQSPWDFYKWPHKGHQGSPAFPKHWEENNEEQRKHGTGNARIPSQRITGVCHLEIKGKAIAEKQLHCAAQRWKDSVHHCFIFTLTADEHSTEKKSCTHTHVYASSEPTTFLVENLFNTIFLWFDPILLSLPNFNYFH